MLILTSHTRHRAYLLPIISLVTIHTLFFLVFFYGTIHDVSVGLRSPLLGLRCLQTGLILPLDGGLTLPKNLLKSGVAFSIILHFSSGLLFNHSSPVSLIIKIVYFALYCRVVFHYSFF